MTRRAVRVSLSVYKDDAEGMRADAAREGLTLSAYVRRLWLAARPREVTAGAWEDRGDGVWVRNGSAWPRNDSVWARADECGWQASDGTRGGWVGVTTEHDVDSSVTRDAADAWLRSRGVVLA